LPHPALEPAPRLLREVFQEERIHCALEADMELADLALGQCHDLDAAERQLLEESRDVLLIARDAVERLRDDNVEGPGPRVAQELL
jgi:hypothetical protein